MKIKISKCKMAIKYIQVNCMLIKLAPETYWKEWIGPRWQEFEENYQNYLSSVPPFFQRTVVSTGLNGLFAVLTTGYNLV